MKKIKAADNLVIELDSGHWQLTNGRSGERPLLAAAADSPVIVYRPVFAQARQLPPDNGLPIGAVDAVVVGWARSDRAWHLGLLLNAEIASARGGVGANWLTGRTNSHSWLPILPDRPGRPWRRSSGVHSALSKRRIWPPARLRCLHAGFRGMYRLPYLRPPKRRPQPGAQRGSPYPAT